MISERCALLVVSVLIIVQECVRLKLANDQSIFGQISKSARDDPNHRLSGDHVYADSVADCHGFGNNKPSILGSGAFDFDGHGQHLVFPCAFSWNDFSVTLFIRTTHNGLTARQCFDGNALIWADIPYQTDDWAITILNNRACFFTGNPDTSITGGPRLNDGEWHHVVVTRMTGQLKKLYVDGSLVASGGTNSESLNASPTVAIGANPLGDRYFKGQIDKVRFYHRVLLDSEIATAYALSTISKNSPQSFLS
jgi:Concanavalin A-like lectin/glucanases superfamily